MRLAVTLRICVLLLAPYAAISQPAPTADTPAIAHVADRAITLEELDAAGGRSLYDIAEQLYEARVRALYQLLSTELLAREAQARAITTDQLLEQEVAPRIVAVNDADIEAFMNSQGGGTPADARTRKQAQMYLAMKRRADAKRSFVGQLFQKHNVRIALAAPPAPPKEQILGSMEPFMGNAEAPVPIVVFSDYRCPYCRALSHTLEELLKKHPDTVRIIYRHFPLNADAKTLAHAALCAADQEQFAEVHHALFAPGVSVNDIAEIAQRMKLDMPGFTACMDEQRHRARIDADFQEGKRLGISGTPTLFVAGLRLRGAQSLTRLSAAVQDGLKARSSGAVARSASP